MKSTINQEVLYFEIASSSLGAGLGICTAVVVKQYVMKPYISSEKALRIVKSAFKQRGPIDGSWIYTRPSLTM